MDADRGSTPQRDVASAPRLAPITCPSCGAPVPLGDGDTTRCVCCGAEVPVPAAYVALREAARKDDAARAHAAALAAALARPPGPWLQIWTVAGRLALLGTALVVLAWLAVAVVMCFRVLFTGDLEAGVAALVLGLFLGPSLMLDESGHTLGAHLGFDWADAWGGAGSNARLGLFFFVALAVPAIVAAYASSFEGVRASLRKLLSAKPPRTSGGVSECRECGAALELVKGELHARCVYCGADNLVDVPDALLAGATETAASDCHDLDAALAAERAARQKAVALAGQRLLGWSALIPAFVVLGLIVAAVNKNTTTFWHSAGDGAPMLPDIPENPALSRRHATLFNVVKSFDDCDASICTAYYFAPLERGERLDLHADGWPLMVGGFAARDIGTWYDPAYTWRAVDLAAGAPYTGWFRVALLMPKHGDHGGPSPRVTWTTSR